MKTKLIIGLFVCLSLIQIITPLSMIAKRERVLKYGKQFKFKTAPFDPYDAFRGRYVALRIEEDYVPAIKGTKFNSGQTVCVSIEVDNQGFAKFTTVGIVKPVGNSYILAKVRYTSKGKVYLDLPINRYYMEENAAPLAEEIYRKHTQRGKQDAYIFVRIKDGFSVVESLYVGDKKIEDAVRQEMEK